jgi:EAL domain-containing protein (putative c-di-GMP-specific phosphodiesterase class I)
MDRGGIATSPNCREHVRVAIRIEGFFVQCSRCSDSDRNGPRNLEPELTETVLMEDAESAMQTLRALKAIGVQPAIDDFGVGYSSFSYFTKIPIGYFES